jgi:hypothetical protein
VKVALVKAATVLLVYAAFALFQAAAAGQPLGAAAAQRPGLRAAARALSAITVAGACSMLAAAIGRGAALLFSTIALALAASVFVLLAPVRPHLAWGAAIVAPFASATLLFVSRGVP